MFSSGRRQRIWLARHRVDFRKAHNGLLAEAYKMNLDPFNGDVIIFNAYPVDSGAVLNESCRYGAAGLSKDYARVSRSVFFPRSLPRLSGPVPMA
jgi:hypothetical protein